MMITDELIEAVKAELLAHGEFGSSSAASEQNAEIAAKAVLEIALSAIEPAGVGVEERALLIAKNALANEARRSGPLTIQEIEAVFDLLSRTVFAAFTKDATHD